MLLKTLPSRPDSKIPTAGNTQEISSQETKREALSSQRIEENEEAVPKTDIPDYKLNSQSPLGSDTDFKCEDEEFKKTQTNTASTSFCPTHTTARCNYN